MLIQLMEQHVLKTNILRHVYVSFCQEIFKAVDDALEGLDFSVINVFPTHYG
jgi:hypothetical protein